MLRLFFPQITEDFIAAYQANYGFTQEGGSDSNSATVSSSEKAVPDSHKKPPEKQKPGPPIQTPNADQPETPSKDTKQKAEKRKAEPGTVTNDA